jgi:hypothetical protein
MSYSDGAPSEDHRKSARRRVLLGCMVAYNDLSISFRCSMRDRSDTGARLRLPGGMLIPDTFWLIDLQAGTAAEAAIAWRAYPEIGVALGPEVDLRAELKSSELRRLKALWMATTS